MPGDTLDYLYSTDRASWEAWKQQIPRDVTIEQRLNDLRDIDRRFDLTELLTDREPGDPLEPPIVIETLIPGARERVVVAPDDAVDINLAALQIRRRCMTALPAARTNGCDKAADEINEIKQVADAILEIDD